MQLLNPIPTKAGSCPWCGVEDPEVQMEEDFGDGTFLFRHLKPSCFEVWRGI